MSRILPAALLLGATLISGCSFAPRYQRPVAPVPQTLPTIAATGEADPQQTVADLGWQEFFTDPRLRATIGMALENNRDLRIAAANVEQARALYRVERSGLLPGVGIDAGGTVQRTRAEEAIMFGGDRTRDDWSASIGAAWEIDLFGRIRNLSEAGLQQFFAATEVQRAARISLIAETANAWLTLAADRNRLEIAEATLKNFAGTLKLTQARFDVGAGSATEVRQAQTSYDAARSDVALFRTYVQQDLNALNLLVGTTVPDDMLPVEHNAQPATLTQLPVGISSEILLRRPDVQAAEHELMASNANIGAARAAFFPTISLTGMFGTISSGLSDLFGSGSDVWSFSPGVSLPIFTGGRNRANLKYSEAARDAAVARYERTIQTAFREVADAIARRSTIDEQLEAQQSLVAASTDLFELAEARYRLGSDPFLATLDAQRTLFAAQQSLIATRLVRDVNLVELYRSLGGGLTDTGG